MIWFVLYIAYFPLQQPIAAPPKETVQLLQAAREALRQEVSEVRTKTVPKFEIRNKVCYVRCGLFGRRVRRVVVPQRVAVSQSVKVSVLIGPEGALDWDNVPAAEIAKIGEYKLRLQIPITPESAGGRASRIEALVQQELGGDFASKGAGISLDRILISQTRKEWIEKEGASEKEVYRIEAEIYGDGDQLVELSVKVQQQKVTGDLVEDKTALDDRAKSIWTALKAKLAPE